MSEVAHAITHSPRWDRTLLVVTYDEWGGFFDHVAPPVLPDDADPTRGQAGFRVPGLLLSPFAHRGAVASTAFDHTSVLRLIEWRWGLAPLAPRDAAANNLATVLDFTTPDCSVPSLPRVADPGPHLCDVPDADGFWQDLAGSPLMRPWRALA